ncbi:NAD(P)H-binding protein [Sphingobacterium sp. SRCM116780]|uniref:NAD(P)H-binding protein n=1 Tax=Sphingobacterium sp. SRCM116780 TaxID=2907623 RepID=UPI001F48133A|nr:NAD(P)H-binding protein [Sphingobacterium sp. SRCM116780]UIR57495.1 NAD(P)H-binding protein [Sphingobacterium sp. SRCM116780]
MKAIVIGGSGATGRELVKQLLSDERFRKVITLVRRPYFESHQKLEEIIVDFEHLASSQDVIKGDVAFSCLGTTLKDAGSKEAQWHIDYDYPYHFAKMAYDNGIASFVLLSAAGANAQSSIFYNRMKGSLEDAIKKIGFAQFLILQPGGIDRPNTDRLGEKIGLKVLKVFNSVGLFKQYEPIQTHLLAKAMIESFFQYKKPIHVLSLKEIQRLTN